MKNVDRALIYKLANEVMSFYHNEKYDDFTLAYSAWMASVLSGKIESELAKEMNFRNNEDRIKISDAFVYAKYAYEYTDMVTLTPNYSEFEAAILNAIDMKIADDNPSKEDLDAVDKILEEDDDDTIYGEENKDESTEIDNNEQDEE